MVQPSQVAESPTNSDAAAPIDPTVLSQVKNHIPRAWRTIGGSWIGRASLTSAGFAVFSTAIFVAVGASGVLDSTLRSTRVVPGSSPPEGVIYALPRRTVSAAVSLYLLHCDVVERRGEKLVQVFFRERTDGIHQSIVADQSSLYVIEQTQLASWAYKSDFSLTFNDQGLIRQVNASSTPLAPGIPIGAGAPSSSFQVLYARPQGIDPTAGVQCGEWIKSELDQLFTLFKADQALQGQKQQPNPKDPNGDERRELDQQFTRTFSLALDPRPLSPDEAKRDRNRAITQASFRAAQSAEGAFGAVGLGLNEILKQFNYVLMIEPETGDFPIDAPTHATLNGIVYRLARDMKVTFCRGDCTPDANGKLPTNDVVLSSKTVKFPQLGMTATMPITRQPFSSQTEQMTINDSGLVSFSHSVVPHPPARGVFQEPGQAPAAKAK